MLAGKAIDRGVHGSDPIKNGSRGVLFQQRRPFYGRWKKEKNGIMNRAIHKEPFGQPFQHIGMRHQNDRQEDQQIIRDIDPDRPGMETEIIIHNGHGQDFGRKYRKPVRKSVTDRKKNQKDKNNLNTKSNGNSLAHRKNYL